MADACRVVLVDDHVVVLMGLQTLLSMERDVTVVGTAVDGDEALDAVRAHDPDVLVVDLQMPRLTGLGVLRALKEQKARTRVVLMGAVMSDDEIAMALRLGARGILAKDRAAAELMRCLRVVMGGGYWLEGTASTEESTRERAATANEERLRVLTPREQQLAACVAKGMRNAEIAQHLGIAEGTVKIHLNRVYRKLGVASRVALTLAIQNQAGR